MKKKILFLVPYPIGCVASQRFRFEQYFKFFEKRNIAFDIQSFLDEDTWDILYQPSNQIEKIIGVFKGFIRRFLRLFILKRYEFVFIHRETAPIGPPVFEWIISKIAKKKIIYDFDDAIWCSNTSVENSLASLLKWHGKVSSICKWSYKVSCGNEFLASYAQKFNDQVIVNPTTIDTLSYHIPKYSNSDEVMVGWTGTHSTLKYLESLKKPLRKLSEKYQFKFIIIANKPPDFPMENMEFIKWNKEKEIDELNLIDIGVMPLSNDIWAKGKCGFKALQFMALECPVLISPVGVNDEIVRDGLEGYKCVTQENWVQKLEILIQDEFLRKKMGKLGRKKVVQEFSVSSNEENFFNLFE